MYISRARPVGEASYDDRVGEIEGGACACTVNKRWHVCGVAGLTRAMFFAGFGWCYNWGTFLWRCPCCVWRSWSFRQRHRSSTCSWDGSPGGATTRVPGQYMSYHSTTYGECVSIYSQTKHRQPRANILDRPIREELQCVLKYK